MKGEKIIQQMEPRIVYLAMASCICLFAVFSFLYLFKKPMKEIKRLQSARIPLEAKVENSSQLSDEIAQLQKKADELNRQLQGKMPEMLIREMVSHTVDQLDRISDASHVSLLGVKPDSPRPIPMFNEIPFDIEASGQYEMLYSWLHEVEKQFGSMVVKYFEIRLGSNPDDLKMKMKMVSYRPLEEEN